MHARARASVRVPVGVMEHPLANSTSSGKQRFVGDHASKSATSRLSSAHAAATMQGNPVVAPDLVLLIPISKSGAAREGGEEGSGRCARPATTTERFRATRVSRVAGRPILEGSVPVRLKLE